MKNLILAVAICSAVCLHAQNDLVKKTGNRPDKIYVFTDKPLYQPNDAVHLTFFSLQNQNGNVIPGHAFYLYFEILNSQKDVVYRNKQVITEGTASAEFNAGNLKGGIYSIRCQTAWNANFDTIPAEILKTFYIQETEYAGINMDLKPKNDLYFPGDSIRFSFTARNEYNELIPDISPEFQVVANGEEISVSSKTQSTNQNGNYSGFLVLSDSFRAENGYITASFTYKGERYSRVYPLMFNSTIGEIAFLPEGGSIFPGIPCNIAFKVIDKNGIGIQARGIIFDENNIQVKSFETAHRGMGKITMTCLPGKKYYAKILQPAYATLTPLPECDTVTSVHMEITKNAEKTFAHIYSKTATNIQLQIALRDTIIYKINSTLKKGMSHIRIPDEEIPQGSALISLWMGGYKVTERMFFFHPEKKLHVRIEKRTLRCGEYNTLSLRILDENGNPVRSKAAVSIVNEKDMNLANDKQPDLFASMFLNMELNGYIEDPNWYFNDQDSEKVAALDLLMLINGWRKIKEIPAWEITHTEKAFLEINDNDKKKYINVSVYPIKTSLYASDNYYKVRSYALNLIPDHFGYYNDYYFNVDRIYVIEDKFLFQKYRSPGFLIISDPLTQNSRRFGNPARKPIKLEVYSAEEKSGDAVTMGTAMIRSAKKGEVINLVGSTSACGTYTLVSVQRGIGGLIPINAAILTTPQGISVRGTRADGNGFYVDGMRLVEVSESLGNGFLDIYPRNQNNNWPGDLNHFNGPFSLNSKTPVIGEQTINIGYTGPGNITSTRFVNQNYYYRSYYSHNYYYKPLRALLPKKVEENANYCYYYKPLYLPYIYRQGREPETELFYQGDLKSDNEGLITIHTVANLNEAVYRITIEGFGQGMVLSDTLYVMAIPDITIDWSAPDFVQQGDILNHKITFKNHSDTVYHASLVFQYNTESSRNEISLAPGEEKAVYFTQNIQQNSHSYLEVIHNDNREWLQKDIQVIPVTQHYSTDLFSTENNGKFMFPMPFKNANIEIHSYASNPRSVIERARRLIHQPYGCFEQVSSSNYPNLVVYDLLMKQDKNDPYLPGLKTTILDGISRLMKYETSEGGYEWFGHTPPHQALTAYGLIQFKMAENYGLIDPYIVQKTMKWLLNQAKEQGGFNNNTGKYDHFSHITDAVNDAYITYALAEAGYKDLKIHTQKIESDLLKKFNPYSASLLMNTYIALNDTIAAIKIIKKIEKTIEEKENGTLSDINITITNSGGNSGLVETYSLYGMGLIKLKSPKKEVSKLQAEIEMLFKNCSPYQTQANALYYQFLANYFQYISRDTDAQKPTAVRVNGNIEISPGISEHHLVYGIPSGILYAGLNQIQIENNHSGMRAKLDFDYEGIYYQDTGNYEIQNNWMKNELRAGEFNNYNIQIKNLLNRERGQTIVTIYFPTGAMPGPEVLNALKKSGLFDHYETNKNSVILYILRMRPNETRQINFGVNCLSAGTFRVLPPSIFAFYEDSNMNTGKWQVITCNP